MALPTRQFYTLAEYFVLEEKAHYKSEYYNGQIYSMAGGSPNHSAIAVNITRALSDALSHTPCRIFNGDLRIAVEQKGLFTYPNASVVCDKLEYAEGRADTITNPQLIVEVLSRSTEKYDRTDKFELYRALKSFETYILIDSQRLYVEVHSKSPNSEWLTAYYNSVGDLLKISALAIEIPVAAVYNKIEFIDMKHARRESRNISRH